MNVSKPSKISNIGKFLDQPNLVKKLNKTMPAVMVGGALLLGANDVFLSKEKEKKNTIIKNICTLGAVIGSSLIAVKGLKFNGKQVIKGLLNNNDKAYNSKKIIEDFLPEVKNTELKEILKKGKEKVFSLDEITKIREETNKTEKGKVFFKKLIPESEGVDSKHLFKEMGRLSLIGLIPVLGGVAGGTLGDKLTDKNWKEKTPNKIKEGFYQYFANIFLCNVGAGAALLGVEKLEKNNIIKAKSKSTRVGAMVGGILTVGILGGSAIANYMAQKVINPLFKKKSDGGIYHERTPDPLDVSLHVDDMASVGVLSGFQWVEPALPLLYSISGYRAGIGYRNHGHHRNDHKKHHKEFRHQHHRKQLSFEHHHRINDKVFSKFTCKEGSCQNYQQA